MRKINRPKHSTMIQRNRVSPMKILGWLPVVFIILGAIFFFPKIKELLGTLFNSIMSKINFLSGAGNESAQEVDKLSEDSWEIMEAQAKKKGVKTTVSSNTTAVAVAEKMNSYSGFFNSIGSTDVPASAQQEIIALLGMNKQLGTGSYGMIGQGLLGGLGNSYIANYNWKGLAQVILSYGRKTLSDRQRFFIGVFLDNTKGTLFEHIDNYFSDHNKAIVKPYMDKVLRDYFT